MTDKDRTVGPYLIDERGRIVASADVAADKPMIEQYQEAIQLLLKKPIEAEKREEAKDRVLYACKECRLRCLLIIPRGDIPNHTCPVFSDSRASWRRE